MSCSIWQHVLLALEHIPSVLLEPGRMQRHGGLMWFGTVSIIDV